MMQVKCIDKSGQENEQGTLNEKISEAVKTIVNKVAPVPEMCTENKDSGMGCTSTEVIPVKTQYVKELKEGMEVNSIFVIKSKYSPREYKNKPGLFFSLKVGDSSGDIPVKYWGDGNRMLTTSLYKSLKVGDKVRITGLVCRDWYDGSVAIGVRAGLHILEKVETSGSAKENRVRCGTNLINTSYEDTGESLRNDNKTKTISNKDTNEDNMNEDNMNKEEIAVSNQVSKQYLPQTEQDIDKLVQELRDFVEEVKNPALKQLLDNFYDEKAFLEMFITSPATAKGHHAYVGGLLEHTLKVT
ncbi:MAG: hypothetical protein QW728_04620, partial [Thermoplasmata archaeon]